MTRLLRAALLCAAFLPVDVEACSCRDARASEEDRIRNAAARSSYVILARVSSVVTSEPDADGMVRIAGTFQTMETFKGDELDSLPFEDEYLANGVSSSCGEGLPELSKGSVTLLYLNEPNVDGWTFNYCSRSRLLQAPEDDAEIRQLRSMRARAEDQASVVRWMQVRPGVRGWWKMASC